MMNNQLGKDIVFLVPCHNIEFSLRGLLTRHESLGFRKLVDRDYDIRRHPKRDPGCLQDSHNFLRPFCSQYAYALVLFDRAGCGKDYLSKDRLEKMVEEQLAVNGWGDRAAAIVFDPELEVWVWSESPHVDDVLGWKGKQPDLTTWLVEQGFKKEGAAKPLQPKEAVEKALRISRKARSAALYKQLAEKVGLKKCTDPAFDKFKTVMQTWFPEGKK